MHRREYLATVVSGLTIAVAGCTGASDDPSDITPTETATDTPAEPIADRQSSVIDAIATDVEREGYAVDLHGYDEDNAWLYIEYVSHNRDPIEEVAVVALAYADHQLDDAPEDAFDVVAINDDGTINYDALLEPGWAQAYREGELSEEAYLDEVESTIQRF